MTAENNAQEATRLRRETKQKTEEKKEEETKDEEKKIWLDKLKKAIDQQGDSKLLANGDIGMETRADIEQKAHEFMEDVEGPLCLRIYTIAQGSLGTHKNQGN